MSTAIRTKIEKILGQRSRSTYIDATSKNKDKYRMKICIDKRATKKQEAEILALPHVVSVGFLKSERWRYCGGITIYFDCKPSLIDLPKEFSPLSKKNSQDLMTVINLLEEASKMIKSIQKTQEKKFDKLSQEYSKESLKVQEVSDSLLDQFNTVQEAIEGVKLLNK